MANTKKRTSPRNPRKKKVTTMPETGATATAAATPAGSITVANKAKGPSSIADLEEPSSSPLSAPSESPEESRSLTSDSETDKPGPGAKDREPSPGTTAPQEVVETPAPAEPSLANAQLDGKPPTPRPAPARVARTQVIKTFEAINGTRPAPSAANAVVLIEDNEVPVAPTTMAISQPQTINGHSSQLTHPHAGTIVSNRHRVEAVTIPDFNPRAANPARNTMGYEYSNLEEISIRQFREDIHAYEHDRHWCEEMLLRDDITPAEARTYQIRILDLSHQIRHCLHRIEALEFQTRRTLPMASRMSQYGSFSTSQRAITAPQTNGYATPAVENRTVMADTSANNANATRGATPNEQAPAENTLKRTADGMSPARSDVSPEMSHKRQKLAMPATIPVDPLEFDNDASLEEVMANGPIMAVQRLGFWKCHLCQTPRYLLAPIGKSPAAPTKWALKDISKMITHFCVMHEEQTVADRLSELGRAFELNRGPFQYWLKTTKNARIDANGNIEGGASIDEIIETLKAGRMPNALRRFSNSARKMRTE